MTLNPLKGTMTARSILLVGFLSLASGLARADPPPLQMAPFWWSSEQDVYTTGMVWRDCDLDGVIDVFFSNGNDMAQAPNMIYLSQGGELPASASWYSTDREYSGHCAVGDINDDGFPDMVVANYIGIGFRYPNRSNLYLNDGYLLNRSPDWYTPDSIFSFSCALGDVDNDGDLDLAFSTGEGYFNDRQQDLVYINEDGVFADVAAWRSTEHTNGYDVAWGDVDNDGDLDLAICHDRNATALYYNQSGVLETVPGWQAATVEVGNTLVIGDVNGDGWLDLIVAYNNQQAGDGYFRVYFNDGTGVLDAIYGWQSATGGYGSALALCDYDNDGDDDLAAGRWFSNLLIYENTGTTFTESPVWSTITSVIAEELAWVDVDGDGVEHLADTIVPIPGRKLFYVDYHPLYAIDSVIVDGLPLDNSDYCYDLFSGWVSLAEAPLQNIIIHYRYSFKNDLVVANWGMVNMAFADTSRPLVDFYADTTLAWVPMTVHFSDSSIGASDWFWQFGDGEISTEQNPGHVYEQTGIYDVTLQVNLPDRIHQRTLEDLIVALADTLSFGTDLNAQPGMVSIPISLSNTQPVQELILPVSYAGVLDLDLLSWTTVDCRTDYFEDVHLLAASTIDKKAVFRLSPGVGGDPLPAGEGAVLILQFLLQGTGITTLDTTSLDGYSLNLNTAQITYQPRSLSGKVYSGLCGNVDGSSDGTVDIGDLTALIAYLYIPPHPIPAFMEQADIDGSADGVIDIGDLSYLIAYLYMKGQPPVCP